MEYDLRGFGIDPTVVAALHDMFDFADESTEHERQPQHPSRAYVRDTKAMRNTPADIIEYPNSYHFVVDMPGLRPDQVTAQIEDGNVLVVSGERRREKHGKEEGVKYLKMERRLGKMLKRFALSEDVNTDAISAVLQDGVLTVTVEKKPPPEPKKPKKIEVKVASGEAGGSGTEVPVHEGRAAGGEDEGGRGTQGGGV